MQEKLLEHLEHMNWSDYVIVDDGYQERYKGNVEELVKELKQDDYNANRIITDIDCDCDYCSELITID